MPRYRLVTTFHTSGAFTEFTAATDGEATEVASDMVDGMGDGYERILVLEEVTGRDTVRSVFNGGRSTVVADEDETFAEPCDRCGTPIASNRDRSPNYCDPCAVIVTAQGGDED